MKKIIACSIVCLVCCLWNTSAANAQAKIGHLNSIEILSNMVEYKSAEKQLETFRSQKEKELKSKEQSLQAEYQSLAEQSQKGLLPPVEAQKKEAEIKQRLGVLQQEGARAEQTMFEKQQQLIKPIQDKVLAAIKQVASENGYNYIIDKSVGIIIYATDSKDVTALVKAKL
ncbi:MAG: OmpH family outer membrane protein [Chitinophagales bacterium]